MSEPLVFAMGNFEARFPVDRHYAKNHMWAQRQKPGILTADGEAASTDQMPGFSKVQNGLWRFGFSAYAVRLLQDVYFLEWRVDAGATLRERQEIGFIESKKAESDLFAPLPGVLTEFNGELLKDPSAINVDSYGPGWLFEMQTDGVGLLTTAEYVEHLAAVWEVTQRTIKGQMNE